MFFIITIITIVIRRIDFGIGIRKNAIIANKSIMANYIVNRVVPELGFQFQFNERYPAGTGVAKFQCQNVTLSVC